MFWLEEYCKMFNLTIYYTSILDKEMVTIGFIDMYNEIVRFTSGQKFKYGDFAVAILEQIPIHD